MLLTLLQITIVFNKNKINKKDLSITRIAGLTWTEWNARLAMPLVTQLGEGAQPLSFPTDLSIHSLDKHTNLDATTRATTSAYGQHKSSPPPSVKLEKSQNGSGSSTPRKISRSLSSCAAELNDKVSQLKKSLNKEEAVTALMLKSEKLNCGNISDTSEENNGVSCVAAAAPDFSLCNINILSSISAMNSLIGAGGNGGLGMSNRSSGGGNVEMPAGSGSGSFSIGHPCPECGRVYKLKSSLRNHQKWECGKEPQFQCPFCVYRAKQKMHIGRHMERMHKEKFIKLEDIKSFTPSIATSGGGGLVGGTGSVGSVTDDSGAASVATALQHHFSN